MAEVAPDVSVIVRSMARASLDAALASLAAQHDADLEVVVVAACGPSHPELSSTSGRHPLRLIASASPLQRAAAANAGLDAATGRWITFLDDDDRFEPGHVAGLLGAGAAAPRANVITSYARAVYADGSTATIGQPFSLAQLYERNFIHLSSALIDRALIAGTARFDESFDVLEDWDFMLQLAQRGSFEFLPVATFQWNADRGDSGAGGGANRDVARFTRFRDRIYAKWAAAREALAERTQSLLERALLETRGGHFDAADALCREALAISVNDPWALNLQAMIAQQRGRITEAREIQTRAVSVMPLDATFVYNLALLDRAVGELDAARRNARKASALAPDFARARTLVAELG